MNISPIFTILVTLVWSQPIPEKKHLALKLLSVHQAIVYMILEVRAQWVYQSLFAPNSCQLETGFMRALMLNEPGSNCAIKLKQ